MAQKGKTFPSKCKFVLSKIFFLETARSLISGAVYSILICLFCDYLWEWASFTFQKNVMKTPMEQMLNENSYME